MSILTSSLEDLHPLGSLLPLAAIVSYLNAIAPELYAAHRRGVVHGAVSPANMMLSNGAIVVYNFGGTQQPTYMAPEQVGGDILPASDQYALGILVYQWLCGEVPFQGSDLDAQHLHTDPPSLRKHLPTIPARVEQVVLKALAKDPVNRYPSVEAFAHAFEQAVDAASRPAVRSSGGQARPSSKCARRGLCSAPTYTLFPGRRANSLVLSILGIAALCVLVVGWCAESLLFPLQQRNIPPVHVHASHVVHQLGVTAPPPTPTPVVQTIPFTLSASVSAASSSLNGMTLDTYTDANMSHDLTQQETDGMILTFTNVSSPCKDITFPAGQITDSVGNPFQIPEDVHLPCSAPTTTLKVFTEQYTQTGTFPANALYAISERLSILPEDPASVLARILKQEEQNAIAQFNSDSTQQYAAEQNPSYQFQEQSMLCVHTDPEVSNGSMSIAEVACVTFLLNPGQLPYSLTQVEQANNASIRTCTLGTATLDTQQSFLTFDGAGNPIVSLTVTLKGTCMALV